jgi:hypothetical protein
VNPYFQSFSCALSYYQYPISTWSRSITSLIIKLMSNSYHLLSISIHVSLINTTMQYGWSSLHNREARRFESIWPSWGFFTTWHMQVYARTRIYIYQPSLRSSKIEIGPALPESIVPTSLRRSSLTHSHECVHDTPAISPLPVRGYRFPQRNIQGVGLPGVCGQYCKVTTTYRPTTNGP